MKMVIVDLEMNQPSNKIIQIGAVCVDTTKNTILEGYEFNQVANPGELPNSFITDLTGITADSVRKAPPLKEVLCDFWSFVKNAPVGHKVGAWGSDVYTLIQQSKEYKVSHKWPKSFDIKQFVCLTTYFNSSDTSYRFGLKKACELWDVPFDKQQQHDAFYDAKIAGELFLRVANNNA